MEERGSSEWEEIRFISLLTSFPATYCIFSCCFPISLKAFVRFSRSLGDNDCYVGSAG